MGDVLFVTGTDTGVGKTVLTALLLVYLRQRGSRALATKPFCSGSLADTQTLAKAQDHQLSLDQITPFYSAVPLAPLLGARQSGRPVALNDVVSRIRGLAERCDLLLVEGAGGLLAPLGEGYTAAELLVCLRCPVLLVARNRLGTVNHSLLTLAYLRRLNLPAIGIVLMNPSRPDSSAKTNPALLAECAAPEPVLALPYLGKSPTDLRSLKENAKKYQKTLALVLSAAKVSTAFGAAGQGSK